MEIKNKLQMHHKNKMGIVMKKFSVIAGSVAGLFLLVALPTYISIKTDTENITQPVEASAQDETSSEEVTLESFENNQTDN